MAIETRRADAAFRQQMNGYRLATAEILYRLPDHRHLLQTYLWQDYDLAPEYPVLKRFLEFWRRELDGPLHSIRIGSSAVITAAEIEAGSFFYAN
ncbi:MAG: hypothetical protein AAFX08_01120 [Pseudomonadota bacterium]